MDKAQAIEHLMKVGILPPSRLAPTHVAARTLCGRRNDPVSWVPVYLRALGHLAYAKPMVWPPQVKPLRETAHKLLSAY